MAEDKEKKIVDFKSANISGKNIHFIRTTKFPKMSQNGLAVQLQLAGIKINKNKIQRIESGEGQVSDILLVAIANVLQVSVEELLFCGENSMDLYSKAGIEKKTLDVASRSPEYK